MFPPLGEIGIGPLIEMSSLVLIARRTHLRFSTVAVRGTRCGPGGGNPAEIRG